MAEKTASNRKPVFDRVTEETRQHFRSAHDEFQKSLAGLFPPEFREHHRKAHREILLAWRSMIDATLERFDREP